jgi:hypothetical protein
MFAARFDTLMVNRRWLRSTIGPVVIDDGLAVNRSNEPIESSMGVVGRLIKYQRVRGLAIPEEEKTG